VQDGIYDEFVSRLVDAVSKLKVGNGLDPDTTVGPLIEQSAIDKSSATSAMPSSAAAR